LRLSLSTGRFVRSGRTHLSSKAVALLSLTGGQGGLFFFGLFDLGVRIKAGLCFFQRGVRIKAGLRLFFRCGPLLVSNPLGGLTRRTDGG